MHPQLKTTLAWHCGTTVASAGTSWAALTNGGGRILRFRGAKELAIFEKLLAGCDRHLRRYGTETDKEFSQTFDIKGEKVAAAFSKSFSTPLLVLYVAGDNPGEGNSYTIDACHVPDILAWVSHMLGRPDAELPEDERPDHRHLLAFGTTEENLIALLVSEPGSGATASLGLDISLAEQMLASLQEAVCSPIADGEPITCRGLNGEVRINLTRRELLAFAITTRRPGSRVSYTKGLYLLRSSLGRVAIALNKALASARRP